MAEHPSGSPIPQHEIIPDLLEGRGRPVRGIGGGRKGALSDPLDSVKETFGDRKPIGNRTAKGLPKEIGGISPPGGRVIRGNTKPFPLGLGPGRIPLERPKSGSGSSALQEELKKRALKKTGGF